MTDPHDEVAEPGLAPIEMTLDEMEVHIMLLEQKAVDGADAAKRAIMLLKFVCQHPEWRTQRGLKMGDILAAEGIEKAG